MNWSPSTVEYQNKRTNNLAAYRERQRQCQCERPDVSHTPVFCENFCRMCRIGKSSSSAPRRGLGHAFFCNDVKVIALQEES